MKFRAQSRLLFISTQSSLLPRLRYFVPNTLFAPGPLAYLTPRSSRPLPCMLSVFGDPTFSISPRLPVGAASVPPLLTDSAPLCCSLLRWYVISHSSPRRGGQREIDYPAHPRSFVMADCIVEGFFTLRAYRAPVGHFGSPSALVAMLLHSFTVSGS